MTESKEEKSDISGKFLDLYEIRKELVNIEYSLSLIRKNCTTLEINLKKSEVGLNSTEEEDKYILLGKNTYRLSWTLCFSCGPGWISLYIRYVFA